jgi:iron complex transport system substrate-binding protein
VRPLPTIGACLGALVLTGCGAAADGGAGAAREVTVSNCGTDVTVTSPPERVVLLKSGAVPYLSALGVMDRVTARAGAYPSEYYDEQTLAALDEVPLLTDEMDTSGHLQISKEVVIAEEPDLVLGEVDNLSRSTLDAVDVPLIEEPALCASGADTDPSFDDVSDQLAVYGEVFDRQEEAAGAAAALEDRVAAVRERVEGAPTRTAAVLYPTVGGGTTYAYGSASMAQPQLEAAGLENVFGDTDERVFEVTLEELLGRDPDVLVLLHSDGDPAAVQAALEDLPGAEELTAVREGQVMTQLFNFTEPATPLAVDGLERIVDRFGAGS